LATQTEGLRSAGWRDPHRNFEEIATRKILCILPVRMGLTKNATDDESLAQARWGKLNPWN
jgi:hypothetical protein